MKNKILLSVFFLSFLVYPVHAVNPELLTDEEYMKAYFNMYGDYIGGGENYTKEELLDVVSYYLTNKDVSENLNVVGANSGEMIGSILADAGVDFDCGTCVDSTLGVRCCIYRIGQVPMAYECVGTEVLGVADYTWKQLWQCTYGCCSNHCCLESGPTTTFSTLPTTTAKTTTSTASTTTSTKPTTSTIAVTTTSTTSTTVATSSTTTSTIQDSPKLTLLFVPVDWPNSADYSSFDVEAEKDVKFLADHTDLKNCPSAISAKKIHVSCPVNMPKDIDECLQSADLLLRRIDDCAKASGEAYDYVIGISATDRCGTVSGLAARIGAIYSEKGYEDLVTHELGHEFGLNDEYADVCRCKEGLIDANANCLDVALGGADPYGNYTQDYCAGGTKCVKYPELTCLGNKNPPGGRCLMSLSSQPFGFCEHCMERLNEVLEC